MFESFLFQSQSAQSFWFGILSALSLPIGALLGIWLKPPKKIVAAVMAFGAGCLLCALTLELISPAFHHAGFGPLALGCVAGGLLFVLLNQALNGQGAFLRKPATIMRHLVKRKKARIKDMVGHLARVDILRSLPPEEIKSVISFMHERSFVPGQVVFSQGEPGDALYMVEAGAVEVVKDGGMVARLTEGMSFGEMALVSGEGRNATVRAAGAARLWKINKEDFDRLVKVSPRLLSAVRELAAGRCAVRAEAEEWKKRVERYADSLSISITDRDVREAAHARGGAAFAIWLGLLLDGIPESAVIGASMACTKISIALIAGLFLANLPEAMSSAVGMRSQGASIGKIMWMWTSLMLITGIGAFLGNLFFTGASHALFAGFEGCAAGAMLVMVAETMLPEAYEQGGAVVGLSTLAGFLTGLLVKSLA